MEHLPLVSIGIPAYNAGDKIKAAINSVLCQTYCNFELIITDDGSIDDTLALIESFQDPRIIVLSDGENRGIAYRLNQQINLAKGFYFARMDADDIMFPNRIATQVNYLRNHPEIDIIGSSAVIIDDNNEILGIRYPPKGVRKISDVFRQSIFIHPTVCGKTSYFKRYMYIEDLKGVEDSDLWIRSFSESRFNNFPEPLLFYRDPYKFKLKTYLFRLKQHRKALWNNRNQLNNNLIPLICIFNTYVKTVISIMISSIGLDHWIIKQRNSVLSLDEIEHYQIVLNKASDDSVSRYIENEHISHISVYPLSNQ